MGQWVLAASVCTDRRWLSIARASRVGNEEQQPVLGDARSETISLHGNIGGGGPWNHGEER
jgi:hypothetical protein